AALHRAWKSASGLGAAAAEVCNKKPRVPAHRPLFAQREQGKQPSLLELEGSSMGCLITCDHQVAAKANTVPWRWLPRRQFWGANRPWGCWLQATARCSVSPAVTQLGGHGRRQSTSIAKRRNENGPRLDRLGALVHERFFQEEGLLLHPLGMAVVKPDRVT